jgi:hypothetical protein
MNKYMELKKIFIYTNIWIAAIAVLAIYGTASALQLPLPIKFYGFMFFATLTSYSLHWYYTPNEMHNRYRETWSVANKNVLLGFLLVGIIGTFYFFGYIPAKIYLLVFPLVLFTFIYTAPKLPVRFFAGFKKYIVAKTVYLAVGWTYATTILPIIYFDQDFTATHYQFTVYRFALLLIICGLFDYRDRVEDTTNGIKTLIANASAPIVIWVLQIVMGIGIIANLKMIEQIKTIHFALNFLPILVLLLVTKQSIQSKKELLYYGLLDGLIGVMGLVCLGLYVISNLF